MPVKLSFIGPVALMLIAITRAYAQPADELVGGARIHPHLQERSGIDSTPFGKIVVLDNRLDTSRFFTMEDGSYPPEKIGFDTSAADAIRRCLEDPGNRTKRGQTTLVINLRELNVPNLALRQQPVHGDHRMSGVRLAKTGETWDYNMRAHLIFTADVFYTTDDHRYHKLFTMRKDFIRWGLSLQESVEQALELLLQTASVAFMETRGLKLRHKKAVDRALKDSGSYVVDQPEKDFSLAEINRSTQSIWLQYPVFQPGGNQLAGRFDTFEDFRAGTIIPGTVKMLSEKNDSAYRIQAHGKDSSYLNEAWGVCDGKDVYIKIANDSYLKIFRQGPEYCFYVPWSLPDMHALLAEVSPPVSDPQNPGSNNLLVDLGVSALFVVAEAVQKKGVNNKKAQIIRDGLKHDYRYCLIDMDSGDILYSRTPFGQEQLAVFSR